MHDAVDYSDDELDNVSHAIFFIVTVSHISPSMH